MKLHEKFTGSAFGKFMNTLSGRITRVILGLVCLILGYIYLPGVLGIVLLVVGFIFLSAGALDLCYISAVLGGPISGKKIRG